MANHTPLSVKPSPEAEPRPTTPVKIEPTLPPEKPLSPEVKDYIEKTTDKFQPPPDIEGMIESTQHDVQKAVEPHLALTDKEIIEGSKMPITSSYRWFAELMKRMLHQAHVKLKVVHGHVKRIMLPSKT